MGLMIQHNSVVSIVVN